jgi:anti-anti-sigma factor
MSFHDSLPTFTLDGCVLNVSGDVGLEEEKNFERSIHDLVGTGQPKLIIDLSEVSYMNGSCVRLVASAMIKAKEKGFQVTIRAKHIVLRLFQMTGLDKLGALELVDEHA